MYEVALGHDAAAIDLDPMVQEPRSQGVMVARRVYTASGGVFEEGLYVELEFDSMEETVYSDLLTQLGLAASYTSSVTINLPSFTFGAVRYNGTAVRPELGKEVKRQNFFIRGASLIIRDLEVAA